MMNNVDNPSGNSARVKKWNWDEDKILEEAILDYPEEVENRWEKIANRIPGKSPDDVIDHYKALILDVSDIEAGRTEFPSYPDYSSFRLDQTNSRNPNEISSGSVRSGIGHVVNRKKSRPWTEDEHRLFLIGLNEYGKSNWRAISRHVVTRTPKQIASHAQMYYKHIAVTNKKNKRSSIYDVTLDVDGGGMVPQPTNFTSHGGYNVTDTVNGGAMVPPHTHFPSHGSYNTIDNINGGATVPPPTNFPSFDDDSHSQWWCNGASAHQFS